MPVQLLETKCPHAEASLVCQSKAGCTREATHHVVAKDGDVRLHRVLCDQHLEELRRDVAAGKVQLSKPAPPAVGILRPTSLPAMPSPPPPAPAPRSDRPRVTFALPASPLVARCRSCDAAIVWINHPRTGSVMPIDFKQGEARGEAHFATCPNANAHRKPR